MQAEKRPILWRQNTEWNALEGIFHKPLQFEHKATIELMSEARDAFMTTQNFERTLSRHSFAIVWKQETERNDHQLFTLPSKTEDVVGVLEIFIPFISVREAMH